MSQSCDSICIGEWILLFLWFVSVPTYCMVIYTIWKHRKTKFKGEFWFLSMSLFVADILHLCQHMWSRKVSSWGLVPDVLLQVSPKLIGWFMLVPHWAFFSAEAVGVVFVSVNRYVTIVKPAHHLLWTRKTTILCICAQWAIAIFVILFNVPVRFNLVWNNATNGSSFAVIIDPAFNDLMSVFIGLVFGLGGLVRVVLFIVLYSHMFYFIYNQRRVTTAPAGLSGQRRSAAHSEFNLAIIGGVLALCDIVLTMNALKAVIVISTGNTRVDDMRVGTFISACFMDIYGWMNGWLLLAFSKNARKQFLKQYRCKKN